MAEAGRPEQPIATSAGALYELASELRQLRRRRGLTYRELARATGLAPSTLSGAAAGQHVPTWKVVRAITRACNGDLRHLRRLHDRALTATGHGPAKGVAAHTVQPPDPSAAETPEQFVSMMRRLREWAGNPSLRELNRRTPGGLLLPPGTVSETLSRSSLPRRIDSSPITPGPVA
ncbi:helix-turn-helix domain-containing protein [Actinomadura fibrosa]|uniref:Helix-turn-helix domain-containing protein n=1 Tax=Actinomadura fibrosa TaxID=111802 RepID=A0ABW2XQ99_9ACTN|nr:helix-turn-helix transcriptional regulator [Actinomadura fibrosa]